MNQTNFVILACRGVGIFLLAVGFSVALPLLYLGPLHNFNGAGWTSYAPIDETLHAEDEAALGRRLFWRGPDGHECMTQFIRSAVGVLLLAFSRPVGRWLTRDLSKADV